MDALNQLKVLGVRVIFEQEELDSTNTDSDLKISIIESIAQAKNESRSENIRLVLNIVQQLEPQNFMIGSVMVTRMMRKVI